MTKRCRANLHDYEATNKQCPECNRKNQRRWQSSAMLFQIMNDSNNNSTKRK